MKNKYFKDLDLVRVIACIAVLLYHFGILKGGYLAVCTFFVLSGYLSCISAFKKENFSFKEYYKNKFLHLYVPLLIVTFLAVAIISLIPSISWLNLKPETSSVLLGYNNYWQLNANLDYFARHVDSPFMHFWYIAILLQFDLIFPFIFAFLKKIGEKFGKSIPCVITFFLSLIGTLHFFKISLDSNIMYSYYDTFARAFSLFWGMFLGFRRSYYGSLIPKRLEETPKCRFVFYTYLLIFISLLFAIQADSKYFNIAMVIVTIMSLRLIDYGSIIKSETNRILKFFASLSYEIYLVQYPIIFLFQDMDMNIYLKYFLMILLILIISYLIHFTLDKKREKFKILRNTVLGLILIIACFGGYNYIVAKDHSAEMQALEAQLAQNQEEMKLKQEEYALKLKDEQEKWNSIMSDLDSSEEKLKEVVEKMPIVGVGDSVMLGALPTLYSKFTNGYFDAAISRTCYVANDILKELIKKNMLGDVIVFNFGANGDCNEATKEKILKTIGNRKLFWLTVTNDKQVHFNDKIKKFAAKYDNLYIIDWETISKGHKEYFYSDGLHLPQAGRKVYTEAIYEGIYQVYLDEFNAKKEAILKEYEEKMKAKISFYGNELLVNAYDSLKDNFKDSNFIINEDFNYEELKAELLKNIENKSLNYKIVFAFDRKIKLSTEEYKEIIKICEGHDIYIIALDDKLKFSNEKVTIIKFYNDLNSDSTLLMADKIHLSTKGNEKIAQILTEILNKEE